MLAPSDFRLTENFFELPYLRMYFSTLIGIPGSLDVAGV